MKVTLTVATVICLAASTNAFAGNAFNRITIEDNVVRGTVDGTINSNGDVRSGAVLNNNIGIIAAQQGHGVNSVIEIEDNRVNADVVGRINVNGETASGGVQQNCIAAICAQQ